ncbi:hypothetical protein CBER1_05866 [Cercospora berteroae]|uniref:Uncharacterized protein n=1 Tax=Cercospora berteroae TaxID=357750 RepID=A0A2S6C7H0_9PEZI|nr:hypothetical protein CBER1_05866 [Cercospora berteroae]
MAKATTNTMPPKPGHTTSPAPKANRPCDMAATANITAHLSRHQFVAGLVEYTSPELLTTDEVSRQPIASNTFNPLDSVFLFSAPEQTITLMAKLCIRIGAKTTILTIPTELRLRIYEYAFEHYKQSVREMSLVDAWDRLAQLGPQPGGPPILRACKLFQQEGMEEYKKFWESVWSVQVKESDLRGFYSQCEHIIQPDCGIDILAPRPPATTYLSDTYVSVQGAASTSAEAMRLRPAMKQRAKRERRRMREGKVDEAGEA